MCACVRRFLQATCEGLPSIVREPKQRETARRFEKFRRAFLTKVSCSCLTPHPSTKRQSRCEHLGVGGKSLYGVTELLGCAFLVTGLNLVELQLEGIQSFRRLMAPERRLFPKQCVNKGCQRLGARSIFSARRARGTVVFFWRLLAFWTSGLGV